MSKVITVKATSITKIRNILTITFGTVALCRAANAPEKRQAKAKGLTAGWVLTFTNSDRPVYLQPLEDDDNVLQNQLKDKKGNVFTPKTVTIADGSVTLTYTDEKSAREEKRAKQSKQAHDKLAAMIG